MEASAAATPGPQRCRSCNLEAKDEEVILNGFNLPFHRSCFPTNRLKSSDSLTRQPLSALNNSAEKGRRSSTPSQKEKRHSRKDLFVESDADRQALTRLHQFAREEGNDICADCSAPQPRWVSVNLGVFLCPQCSGEHRALGSHISRVRSLGLDHWTADGVKLILEWGNKRGNEQWEACVPEGYSKPGPLTTPAEKRCWVRAKYLHKAFVAGADFRPEMLQVPPPATAGPCYVGVLRVTVVSAAFRKRMKTACVLRLGRQSVTTKRAPTTSMPMWGETHMLSLPSADSVLEILVRKKTRFGSRVFSSATVKISELPLRELQADERHEVVVPLKAGATVTLQMALLCTE